MAEREGWNCHYCGKALSPPPEKRKETVYTILDNGQPGWYVYTIRDIPENFVQATLDHKIPRSKGGDGGLSNLVLSCVDCNNEKSDKYTYQEFMDKKKKYRGRNGTSSE